MHAHTVLGPTATDCNATSSATRAYTERVDFLRRRDFTCSCTGKTGLTYEEALLSESRATAHKPQVTCHCAPWHL
jgi:ATP-utilising chromatin assembly and remodelling N-terminal